MKISMKTYSEVQTKLVDELSTVIMERIGEFYFKNVNMIMDNTKSRVVMEGVVVRADNEYFKFEVNITGEVGLELVPF